MGRGWIEALVLLLAVGCAGNVQEIDTSCPGGLNAGGALCSIGSTPCGWSCLPCGRECRFRTGANGRETVRLTPIATPPECTGARTDLGQPCSEWERTCGHVCIPCAQTCTVEIARTTPPGCEGGTTSTGVTCQPMSRVCGTDCLPCEQACTEQHLVYQEAIHDGADPATLTPPSILPAPAASLQPSYTPGYAPSYTPTGSGPVHVRGYFRRDGTYVRPHTRSRPH